MNDVNKNDVQKFSTLITDDLSQQEQRCKLYDLSIVARVNQACKNVNSIIPNIPNDKKKAFIIQLGKNILKAKGKDIND